MLVLFDSILLISKLAAVVDQNSNMGLKGLTSKSLGHKSPILTSRGDAQLLADTSNRICWQEIMKNMLAKILL